MDSNRKAALERMKARMAQKLGGSKDSEEFRCKAVKGEEKDYYFVVLPPVGDDDFFAECNGHHYINNHYVQCPRIHEVGKCPLCQMAFNLLEGVDDEETRRAIGKKYLPQQKFAVNIMFTDETVNGEYAGKVMWFNAPQSVFKKMKEAWMRADAGEDARKPKAFGDFYCLDEAYIFNLHVTEKGGYNNYDQSDFTVDKPIKIPNQSAILTKRHNLKSKFGAPNMDELTKFADKAMSGIDEPNEAVVATKQDVKVEQKHEVQAVRTSTPVTPVVEAKTQEVAPKRNEIPDQDPELEAIMSKIKSTRRA